MSPDQMKDITQKTFHELWNNANLDIMEETISPDYTLNGETSFQSLKDNVTEYRKAVPDLKAEILDIFAEGDKVAWRMTWTGTHQGEFQGIAPTGKPVKATGIAITQFVDGKSTCEWYEGNWPGFAE